MEVAIEEVVVEDTLLAVHGYVRYVVLLVGVAAAIAAAAAWRTVSEGGLDRRLAAAYAGVLDVQVLLGVALLTQIEFYGALMGHITMMLAAAIVAHVGSVIARRRAPTRPAAPVRFVTVAVSLVLIVGGIMAIGRTIL